MPRRAPHESCAAELLRSSVARDERPGVGSPRPRAPDVLLPPRALPPSRQFFFSFSVTRFPSSCMTFSFANPLGVAVSCTRVSFRRHAITRRDGRISCACAQGAMLRSSAACAMLRSAAACPVQLQRSARLSAVRSSSDCSSSDHVLLPCRAVRASSQPCHSPLISNKLHRMQQEVRTRMHLHARAV